MYHWLLILEREYGFAMSVLINLIYILALENLLPKIFYSPACKKTIQNPRKGLEVFISTCLFHSIPPHSISFFSSTPKYQYKPIDCLFIKLDAYSSFHLMPVIHFSCRESQSHQRNKMFYGVSLHKQDFKRFLRAHI